MENTKHRVRLKKRYFMLIIIALVLASFLIFFQFTSIGYRMTVPYRNFTEVRNNVYIANDYSYDRDYIISILDDATSRVSDFWGNIESSPIIIICDNEKTLQKLGGDRDTTTVIFFKAYSYISISSKYINVNVVAHEMTHAELHSRIYDGKLPQKLFPTWFDEGVATQNDYRTKYNDEAWSTATNNGLDIIDLSEIDTVSEFYSGKDTDRVERYIISRHELKEWIGQNGIDGLKELILKVNAGEDFYKLYFKI